MTKLNMDFWRQVGAMRKANDRKPECFSLNRGHPRTPDNRYFVVRGRLWRLSNPTLELDEREKLVRELMAARRAVSLANGDSEAVQVVRRRVHAAKVALGERGPVWWEDGAPDYNRRLAVNTPYAAWYSTLPSVEKGGDT